MVVVSPAQGAKVNLEAEGARQRVQYLKNISINAL
jgi:hypothetical protein